MPEAVGTPIDIGLPLPLEVAGTLMALVGAAYPDCVIDTTGARGNGLHIVIPAGSRTRKVGKAEARKTRAVVEGEDGPSGNQFAGFSTGADGKVAATLLSEDEVIHSLAAGALAILERHEAENYVEWTLTSDGRSLAVSACWSESQTPHQLRLAAEARADAAEAELARLREAVMGSLEHIVAADETKPYDYRGARSHRADGAPPPGQGKRWHTPRETARDLLDLLRKDTPTDD